MHILMQFLADDPLSTVDGHAVLNKTSVAIGWSYGPNQAVGAFVPVPGTCEGFVYLNIDSGTLASSYHSL